MFALKSLLFLDRYEFKARLVPAIASCLPAIPGIASVFSLSNLSAISGTTLGAVLLISIAIALSYTSSLVGRRYEKKLWPDWPYDAPTNVWLDPTNTLHSRDQKRIWYQAIRNCTKLDIQQVADGGNLPELARVINDAVVLLRQQFRNLEVSPLLYKHNEDYGFARNLAGFRVIWLPASFLSLSISGAVYLSNPGTSLVWCVLSVLSLAASATLYFLIESFVRQRADRYAESFFGALAVLNSKMEETQNG